jgi:macrolide-specific efflux system membrane fusion protein
MSSSGGARQPRKGLWLVNSLLAAALVAVGLLASHSLLGASKAPTLGRTVRATIGTVQSTVTASGNVASADTADLSFASAGTVQSIDVSVGQHVSAGQVLASLDSSGAQAALEAAQDQLSAAQDQLSLAQSGNETPPEVAQDNAALAADAQQVNQAQAALSADQATLAQDQAACPSPASASSSSGGGGSADPSQAGPTTTSASGSAGSTSPCAQVAAATQTVTQAQDALDQAQNNLSEEQLAIAAKRYVSPATLAQDQAAVTQAEQAVANDTKALAGMQITAPFSGTITAINGTVGQDVSGGGSGVSTTSGSASNTSANSDFITLEDLSQLEVVAGFPEAEAVKIQVGQPALVSLAALPGVIVSGKVSAVALTPTVVANVVTYSDTIALTDVPPSVKVGMTTSVSVVVDSVADALELPSAAITTAGSVSTVEVLEAGHEVTRVIKTGLVGDTETQVLSGISAGTLVVEPTLNLGGPSTPTRTAGIGAAFGGGFGGGGLGGGVGGRG